MKVQNVDCLKVWLANAVSVICDAEPDDLAKYIVALLKKDKTDKELEELCQKELQVFFKENTIEFLSKLFTTLRTESYLSENQKDIKKLKNELNTPVKLETDILRAKLILPKEEEEKQDAKKIIATKQDDKQNENLKFKQSRTDGRDLKSRLGDTIPREYRRYCDREDYERRERRRRSRDRSPLHRRRLSTSRHHHEELRSARLRRRSRERSRSWGRPRSRERSRSPFNECGFRSAKYFASRQKSRSPNDHKSDGEQGAYKTPDRSRSSSIDLKDDKEYRITIPLDNLMNNNQKPPSALQTHYQGYTPISGPPVPLRPSFLPPPSSGISTLQIPGSTHLLTGSAAPSVPSMVIMATPNSQPSLVQTAPPPLPINYRPPLSNTIPQFAASPTLFPPVRPPQHMVVSQSPQILQHFTRFPPSGSLVSLPPGINFQPPNIIIPKESAVSRQVIGFGTGLCTFPPPDLSVKSRLGIKVDKESGMPDWSSVQSCTLLINNVPPPFNNISSINQQFSKFGPITNIQVRFGGSVGSALISFANRESADAAFRSSEPVFNNRFIEVVWHHGELRNAREVVLPDTRRPVKERLGGSVPEINVQVPVNSGETSSNVEPRNDKDVELDETADVNSKSLGPLVDSIRQQQRTVLLMPSNKTLQNSTTSSQLQSTQLPASHQPFSKTKRTISSNKHKLDLMNEVEKRKRVLNMKKRIFLEEQLQKQKMLLDELEKHSLSAEEKIVIKKRLKEMTLESQKLKSELHGNAKFMKPTAALSSDVMFSSYASKSEIKKQILDAELDLISRAKEGLDVKELDKNINMMKMQAALFLKKRAKRPAINRLAFYNKTAKPYFKQSSKPLRGLTYYANVQIASRLLDRRPKQLIVTGFPPEKKNAVLAHLGKFGKLEKFVDGGDEMCMIVTYSTRKEAEKVARLGTEFEGVTLSFSWPKTSSTPVSASSSAENTRPSQESVRDDEESEKVHKEMMEDDEDDGDSDTMIELVIEDDGANDLVEQSLIDEEALLHLS